MIETTDAGEIRFQTEIEERKKGRLAIVSMRAIAPNNTLNLEGMQVFEKVMNTAMEQADVVLLTSDHEKFFCNGLDGKTLLDSDDNMREATILEMIRIYGRLWRLPKPWIVEIAGHAMAGGAVISTAADNRFMISAGARIGFTELQVGLPLPACYPAGYSKFVQPSAVIPIMEGQAYKAEEALAVGLIDGIADDRQALRKIVLKRVDQILKFPPDIYNLTRNSYRRPICDEIDRLAAKDVTDMSALVRSPAFEAALNVIAGKNRS